MDLMMGEARKEAAIKAGIKVPETEKWNVEDYPHWHVFNELQQRTTIASMEDLEHNARIIASIQDAMTVKMDDVEPLGWIFGNPITRTTVSNQTTGQSVSFSHIAKRDTNEEANIRQRE